MAREISTVEHMRDGRSTARIIGVLFIVASLTAIIGGSLAALPFGESNYLADVADKEAQIVTGVLLLVVQTVAVLGIAVFFFPVLRRRDEAMALGYFAAKTVEGVLVVVTALGALSILSLSRDYGQAGALGAEPLGDTLVAVYDWAYWLGPMIFLCISALILYTVLYQARLVPVWLSIWGLVGGVLLLVRAVLEMYGAEFSAALQAVFAAPIGINEMVLAIWLIVKGFNAAPGIASIPASDTPATWVPGGGRCPWPARYPVDGTQRSPDFRSRSGEPIDHARA